jgi:hypothetical protein
MCGQQATCGSADAEHRRDDADPKVIGVRAKNVFAINNDVFADRIAIQEWQQQQGLVQ